MEKEKYKIIAKIYTGVEISHLVLENSDGNTKTVVLKDVIKLARNDRISNAKSLLDDDSGEYILKIGDGLASIEERDANGGLEIELHGRLIDSNNKCVGYKAKDSNGKNYKLSISKVWDLALKGFIKGVDAKIVNGHKILNSTYDLDLKILPIIKNN